MLAAAAGTAALIQLVGGAVMYLRFEDIDVPPAQTVAALPKELLFVIGARSLVPLILAGLLAVAVLYGVAGAPPPPPADDEPELAETDRVEQYDATAAGPTPTHAWRRLSRPAPVRNERGDLPDKFDTVLSGLAGVAVVAIAASDVGFGHTVFLGLVALALGLGGRYASKWTNTLSGAAWSIFLVTLVFGTVLALSKTIDQPVRLDLGAVETKPGKARIGGFFLARTDSVVLLVTRPEPDSGGPQVTVFAKEDVGQLKYGPRGVTVDADGYAKAEALAQRLDTVPPRLKAHAAVKQRAKGGRVHVDASCNEVCRIRVSGFLVGRGVMPIRLAAVTRKDLPAKTTAHLAVALPVNFAQIARQHRRLRVRLRIAARDRGGNTAVKNARIRVRP